MLEIERKFLVDGFPTGLTLLKHVEMEQAYLSVEPEIRIHKAVDTTTGKTDVRMTVKGDGALTREEIKTDIGEDFYQDAMRLLGVKPIIKEYRAYQFGPWLLEVAHVDPGTQNAFFYAEIEFPTEEEANAFIPTEYFRQDVTFQEAYKMKNYWKSTRL